MNKYAPENFIKHKNSIQVKYHEIVTEDIEKLTNKNGS
jgi:hypothetical protein